MKNILKLKIAQLFFLANLLIHTSASAQAPQGFNYQATVRNSSGALIINQNVLFKFNIMLNSQTSLPVYSETHQAPTDDLGQVNLVIGTGTATIGTFSSINWGNGSYFLGIELNAGAGYVTMGTTQLLSVPYALYANTSGNAQAATPNLASVLAVNNGANNLQIKNLADPTDAQDAVTKAYLETQLTTLQAQINSLQNLTVTPSVNQQVICTGNSTQVGLSSNQLGATFTWTASVLSVPSGGTINGFSSGTGNEIAQILVNTGSSAGIVRYIVTPHIGLIAGQPINIDITVNPIPVISGGQNFQLCNNITLGTLFISNNDIVPTGTTYTWTSTGGSNMNTPQPFIYENQNQFTEYVTLVQYTITPHFAGCVGNPFTVWVNYSPVPLIPNQTINASNNSPFNVNLISAPFNGIVIPNNTTYTWTVSTNPNVTGASNQNFPGVPAISQTLINLTNTPQIVTYTVTPQSDFCVGNPFTITVTVNPTTSQLPSVTIGTQIWSSTNLDVTTYRDGTPIPQVTDPTQWANLTTGAWCYYANNAANGSTFGKLYNWYAVAGIHDNDPNTPNKILAPIGWHVPTNLEWSTLTSYLGGDGIAGGKMKEIGLIHWASPNAGATNESGFTGLPGGIRNSNGSFGNLNFDGTWWSSTEMNSTSGYNCDVFYSGIDTYSFGQNKISGLSIRCIRD